MEKSLEEASSVARAAVEAKMTVRGYVSCVVHCAYEGKIRPGIVARLVEKLLDAGCYESKWLFMS